MPKTWKDYAPYALLALVIAVWQRQRLWAGMETLASGLEKAGPWLFYVFGALALALAAWGALSKWYHGGGFGDGEPRLQDRRTWVLLLILTLGSALGIWGTYFASRLLSGLDMPATYFAMVVISLLIFFLIDRFAFDAFDTIEKIEDDPVAVAITYLSIAVLFLGAGLALGA
jgi:hypothetical protein